jgi:hypothetical protein
MATIGGFSCHPVKTISGNPPQMLTLPEGASVTAKMGELARVLNGYVVECGDDPDDILGFFAEDAHNTATDGLKSVQVWVANADTIFEANITNAGSDKALLQIHLFFNCSLYRDTTNSRVYVDVGDVSNKLVVIVDMPLDIKRGKIDDTNARVWFKVLATKQQLTTAS